MSEAPEARTSILSRTCTLILELPEDFISAEVDIRLFAVKLLDPVVLASRFLVVPAILILEEPLRLKVVFFELALAIVISELPLLFTSSDFVSIRFTIRSDESLEAKLTFLLSNLDSTFTSVLPLLVIAFRSL